MSKSITILKQFAMTNRLLENDLSQIEKKYSIDLQRGFSESQEIDQDYYPQIEQSIRAEAAKMAPHYEVFYSLERSVKNLVIDTLHEAEGDDWWSSERVPRDVRDSAGKAQTREIESGVTPRSTEGIDFTTFGELGEIIKLNWDLFGGVFTNKKAVEKVMSSLNTLRGPVAHCSPLADDEILRLRLTVKDWFRLME